MTKIAATARPIPMRKLSMFLSRVTMGSSHSQFEAGAKLSVAWSHREECGVAVGVEVGDETFGNLARSRPRFALQLERMAVPAL